jgi:hypothetical protein
MFDPRVVLQEDRSQENDSGVKPAFQSLPLGLMKRLQSQFLLVASLALSALLASCGSSADSAADHFMSLLVAGKHLEAQEMLSKDMRSMATMLGGVSDQSLNPYYRSGHFKSFTLTQIEKTNNSIRYKVRAITANGQAFDDFLDLVQEDGKWKVAKF